MDAEKECIICHQPGKECGSIGDIELIYCEEHCWVWAGIKRELKKAHYFCINEEKRLLRWKKKRAKR